MCATISTVLSADFCFCFFLNKLSFGEEMHCVGQNFKGTRAVQSKACLPPRSRRPPLRPEALVVFSTILPEGSVSVLMVVFTVVIAIVSIIIYKGRGRALCMLNSL